MAPSHSCKCSFRQMSINKRLAAICDHLELLIFFQEKSKIGGKAFGVAFCLLVKALRSDAIHLSQISFAEEPKYNEGELEQPARGVLLTPPTCKTKACCRLSRQSSISARSALGQF